MHSKIMTVILLSIFLGGCAGRNKPEIDLIPGESFGITPDNPPPADKKIIWFTEYGWNTMVGVSVDSIKKKVAK